MDTAASIIQILLALVFLASGGLKLAGVPMQVANFHRYGYSQSFRLVTGGLEVLAAAGMVVGLFVDEIAIAAAVGLSVIMVGAVYTDIRSSPPMMVLAPVVFLAMSVAVIVLRLGS